MKTHLAIRLMFATILAASSAPLALAQSNDERRPTPVIGNRIQESFDTQQGSATYYYSVRLNPGGNKAVLKAEFECGASISISLDGQPTFSPATSNTVGSSTRCTATIVHNFVVNKPKNVSVTLYLGSIPNDKFNVDLSFSGGTISLTPKKPGMSKK